MKEVEDVNDISVASLEYICQLHVDLFNIPIQFINKDGEVSFSYTDVEFSNPIFPSLQQTFVKQVQENLDTDCEAIIWESNFFENFAIIHFQSNQSYVGSIIIGPIIYTQLHHESIEHLLKKLNKTQSKDDVCSYYDSLPILSKWNLTKVIESMYFMIYTKKLHVEKINQKNEAFDRIQIHEEDVIVHVATRRQNLLTYANPLIEKKIIHCIKTGRKDELEYVFSNKNQSGEMGILDKKSHLRSEKNLAIVGISLATRAAIDGGLHPEIAFTLSDLFIQHVENLNESTLVMQFLKKAFIDFSDHVHRNNTQKYSPKINLCINYVSSHLYDDIALHTLASHCDISESYLSTLFKQEVGKSLIEYIQQEKIKEAMNLITYTHSSLLEISSVLNFTDQSYFTKVFKKHTGVTPNQFKQGEKIQIIE